MNFNYGLGKSLVPVAPEDAVIFGAIAVYNFDLYKKHRDMCRNASLEFSPLGTVLVVDL